MRRILIVFVCLLAVGTAFGQFTSRQGYFRVDQIRGCAPFTITITDTNLRTVGECTPGKPCLMDFQGNNTQAQNTFGFTYNTPGTYRLTVTYGSIGSDDITVTVFENVEPAFEVYTCTGDQVSLKVTDRTYETYKIDFNGDGVIDTTIPQGNNATASFSYPLTPGPQTYPIRVRGQNTNSADNCKNKTESYTTLDVLPTPSITTLTAEDANKLRLNMGITPHIQYKLEIALNSSGPFQVYQNLYQQNVFEVPNLLVDQNYYCFRLSAFDPCAGTNTYSNTICSHDFDVSFQNGVNQLAWRSTTGGVTSVDVRRNKAAYTNIVGAPTGYNDRDYDCNVQYCYQIISNYAGGGKSVSLEKCGIGILQTTFPPIDNVSSIVVNGVRLEWDADDDINIRAFDILRRSKGGVLEKYSETPDESYTDNLYNTDGQYCYQVNYSDFCNNRSQDGIVVCPIRLFGTIDDKNAITLNWSKYAGYVNGVSGYEIIKKNSAGVIVETFATTDTTFTDFDPNDDQQIVSYEISASANTAGIPASISNDIRFEKQVRLIFPTAFTPNGDARNPLFTISGKFVRKMSISIFDRWGILVYTSENNEPWNGTRDGKVMPESAYVWKAEVTDFVGHTFSREGTVLLLRPPN